MKKSEGLGWVADRLELEETWICQTQHQRVGTCSASHGTLGQSRTRTQGASVEDLSTYWVLDTVRKMNDCCEKYPGMGRHTRPESGVLDQLVTWGKSIPL